MASKIELHRVVIFIKGNRMSDKTSKRDELTDAELMRYSRQIMLPKFDIAGQLALVNAKVLIVGLGGLGSPVALYLASAGVGHLFLADYDCVDTSNLQRQIIHRENNVNRLKVESAAETLHQLNSLIKTTLYSKRFSLDELDVAINKVDVVVDCSDNFETRIAINKSCVRNKTPLVSGAAIRMEGQVSVFDFRQAESPCYQCLFPEMPNESRDQEDGLSCSESGVMAPLVGIIGSMQAMETLKLLSGLGETLSGRLLLLDAMSMQWRSLKLNKDVHCACCSI